ncbi:hypothetical protein Tco_1262044 [Tanacetum coccineum]
MLTISKAVIILLSVSRILVSIVSTELQSTLWAIVGPGYLAAASRLLPNLTTRSSSRSSSPLLRRCHPHEYSSAAMDGAGSGIGNNGGSLMGVVNDSRGECASTLASLILRCSELSNGTLVHDPPAIMWIRYILSGVMWCPAPPTNSGILLVRILRMEYYKNVPQSEKKYR